MSSRGIGSFFKLILKREILMSTSANKGSVLVVFLALSFCFLLAHTVVAETGPMPGDKMLSDYFRAETARLKGRCLDDIKSLDDWNSLRLTYRKQLFEMLGLDPMPPKTDLKPVVTGIVDHEEFTVENIHFQSMPGLYVTGNLYIPKNLDKPAPTILYLCGHGRVKIDGVDYGNKTYYHHHGAWFARNGYVCLSIDTVQLGEIEGVHHGTYSQKMWWWNSRGYTPAGIEALDSIRALDYLETREEVDADRIGVTGRSGGGASSWWISALDERIKVSVPVAGLADMQSQVVDDCVERQCDCMYYVNTYRWDHPMIAALVAPRALLISNTDKDPIFPLDGVVRLHKEVRKIYRLYGADGNLGLNITEGGHNDTQELRTHAFVWFNRFLKGDESPVRMPAEKFFTPQQLKVFDKIPEDEINTKVHEIFSPKAADVKNLDSEKVKKIMSALKDKTFNGWPASSDVPELEVKRGLFVKKQGVQLVSYNFTSQENVRLSLYVIKKAVNETPTTVTLSVLDEAKWTETIKALNVVFSEELKEYAIGGQYMAGWDSIKKQLGENDNAIAFFGPRGVGLTAWNKDLFKRTQIRRRFMLLGQTLDGMRLWDVRRACQVISSLQYTKGAKLGVSGSGVSAGLALYASIYEPEVKYCELTNLPSSHREGPFFLNVLKILDIPQAIEIAKQRCEVKISK